MERKPNVSTVSQRIKPRTKVTDRQLPMLSVTVMMLRLIVESVMLLKEEDWQGQGR